MKQLGLSLCGMLALALAAGDARANAVSIYTAKFLCGDGGFSSADPADAGAVTRADYRTAINIVNPNNKIVVLSTQVVLTEARSVTGLTDIVGLSPQVPLSSPETETLSSRDALQWDCDQLGALFYHNFSAGGFAKGFLIIVSDTQDGSVNAGLNVTGVYSTRGKDTGDRAVSLDTEQVMGRRIQDSANQIASDHHEDGD